MVRAGGISHRRLGDDFRGALQRLFQLPVNPFRRGLRKRNPDGPLYEVVVGAIAARTPARPGRAQCRKLSGPAARTGRQRTVSRVDADCKQSHRGTGVVFGRRGPVAERHTAHLAVGTACRLFLAEHRKSGPFAGTTLQHQRIVLRIGLEKLQRVPHTHLCAPYQGAQAPPAFGPEAGNLPIALRAGTRRPYSAGHQESIPVKHALKILNRNLQRRRLPRLEFGLRKVAPARETSLVRARCRRRGPALAHFAQPFLRLVLRLLESLAVKHDPLCLYCSVRRILAVEHMVVQGRKLHRSMQRRSGGATDEQRNVQVPRRHLPAKLLHLEQARRYQAAHPDDGSLSGHGGIQDLRLVHHHSQVLDLKAVASQDNPRNILSDIVHITLDRSHYHKRPAAGGLSVPLHVRLQNRHGVLHHLRGLDHLREKHLALAEQHAHALHPGHQRPLDDLDRSPFLFKALEHILPKGCALALDQRLSNPVHGAPGILRGNTCLRSLV